MRVVVTAAMLALFAIGCSGTSPTGQDVSVASTPESDATTSQPTAVAMTTTTLGAVEEPTNPLFSGERGDSWHRAWADLDIEALAGFFSDDAIVNGTLFENAMTDAKARHPDPIGWTETFEDCIYRNARYVTCDVAWTSAIHGPAGLEVPVHRSVYFDDQGLISLYRDDIQLEAIIAFEIAIAEWLAEQHPEIRPIDWDADSYESYAETVRDILEVVDEFVAWSEDYPPAEPVVEDPVLTGTVGGIDVYNATEQQMALVEWALHRFRIAQLPLPPVTAVVFPPTAACVSGASGRAYHNGTEGTIDVCAEPEAFADSDFPMTGRRTILHELGHIWIVGHTTDETRTQFMTQRGVSAWSGTVWEDSGSEHAAEIMMWALIDKPVVPRLSHRSTAELEEAYTILTGRTPPTVANPTNP